MFRLILAGLLFGVLSTQAGAATYRYSFDVVSSSFGFQSLSQFNYDPDAPPADTTTGPADYAAFTAAHHPLAHLIGQTGSVAFDLEVGTDNFDCVSGFLCADLNSSRVIPFPGMPDPNRGFGLQKGAMWWTFYPQLSGTQPPGSGSLSFGSDSLIYEIVEWNGGYYFLGGDATAGFSLANMEIAPVPLPAGAPLLAMGLLALGSRARRRKV